MSDLFFWRDWDESDKRLYWIALLLLAVALISYLTQFFIGNEAVIHWQTQSELDDVPVILEQFVGSALGFSVEASTYTITERFVASDMTANHTASYLFLFLLSAGVLFVLSTLTFLSRIWYAVGMAGFILLLTGFRLELLEVLGLPDNVVLGATIALYSLVSYYFQAFREQASFGTRLLVFTLITLLLAALIGFSSSVAFPVFHLTNYGIVVPMLIAMGFTFTIAAEIMNGFLYLITRSNNENSQNSFRHFGIVSGVYLLNVLLLYMRNAHFLELDIFLISPFFLYIISLVVGVWGYRSRITLFDTILPFSPYGAFLYAGLAIISTSVIGYIFATANDPLIEVFEDTIVFSHLTMGVAFFIYVLFNFGTLLQQNKQVYKVVYKPRRLPFFVVRGMAVLAIVALFFRAGMFPYYQALGGYYNGLGDVSTATQEYFLAEQYYKQGLMYATFNHKSNYALASLARVQDDHLAAGYYFKEATQKHPSPHDYVNWGNALLHEDLFFQAIFALKEGVAKFPQSGELYNNLALLYNRTNIADSAFLYFDLAREYAQQREVPEANLMAFWAKNPTLEKPDSILKATSDSDYLPLQANRMALANRVSDHTRKPLQAHYLSDSVLTRNTFAYVYNYTLNQASNADSSLAQKLYALERVGVNGHYAEDLTFARVCYEYYGRNRGTAIETMKQLSRESIDRGDYLNKTLGTWLIRQGAYRLATDYLGQSKDSVAHYYRAVALEKVGSAVEAQQARQLLDSLKMTGRTPQIAPIFTLTQQLDSLLDKGQVELANDLYTKNQPDPSEPLTKLSDFYLSYLHLLAAQRQYAKLLADADKLPLSPQGQDAKLYYVALAYENTGNLPKAEATYQRALLRTPLHEALIVRASQFFEQKRKKQEKAYDILVTAVQLNPYSVPVYKAYILQCLNVQLVSYAEQGLAQLQKLTSPTDYQAFLSEYQAKVALIEKMSEGFE